MSFESSELPTAPILWQKHYDQPSIFTPENLLREARRQKGVESQPVPAICILDPDGDLVDSLRATGQAHPHPTWACYHTTLLTWEQVWHHWTGGGCSLCRSGGRRTLCLWVPALDQYHLRRPTRHLGTTSLCGAH